MRGSWPVAALVVAVVAGLGLPSTAAADGASTTLPAGMPPAAYAAVPALPEPDAWPFGDGFPRTSGAGRVVDGATFWSDFLYDDNGPVAAAPLNESPGAPSFGGLRYPEPEAHNNGADIFRAAIGTTADDTWWRVDWLTLADVSLPVAAFAIDLDDDPATGTAAWGLGTGLRSDGTDAVLLVSSAGAWLRDLADGSVTAVDELGGAAHVDVEAKSFVVRLPRSVLAVEGTSKVRLASGLASDDGAAFRQLSPEHGWLPGLPNVFNVTFRDYEDEPALHNFWFEQTQAVTLATGDVTDFALVVDWDGLDARVAEPEPIVTGSTNRWYASNHEFGDGIRFTPESLRDDTENYLGRVQPYAMYVPTSYVPGTPTGLTWMLPAYIVNHNQFVGTAPSFMVEACEDRGVLCASPNGRGPDGFYARSAELDFWEVWRDVATHFTLDVDRTILGGYSMGGYGTSRLAQNHPHLFAATYMMASSPEGLYDGLVNLGEVEHYHGHPLADSNVPIDEALAEIAVYDENGHRYTFDVYPGEDHVEWPIKDDFGDTSEWLASKDFTRTSTPRDVVFHFDPADRDDALGIGPRAAYWLGELQARDTATTARIDATAASLPDVEVEVVREESLRPQGRPSPSRRQTLAWVPGEPKPLSQAVTIAATNVASATLDLAAVALDVDAPDAFVEVTTDGPLTLVLSGLGAGRQVLVDGEPATAAPSLAAGTHRITFAGPASPVPGATPPPVTGQALPVTGPAVAAPLVGALLLAGLGSSRGRRRRS